MTTGIDSAAPAWASRRVLAVALGLLAVGGGVCWRIETLRSEVQAIREERARYLRPVVMAATTLSPGVPIRASDVVGLHVPAAYVGLDGFSAPHLVIGRVPRERILPNELVRPERLANADRGIGLNVLIPQGRRAMSVEVRSTRGVEVGDRIDLIVSVPVEGGRDDARAVVQNVGVVGVPSRNVVTLQLTPEEAESVATAEQTGTLTFALRSDGWAPMESGAITDPLGPGGW